MSTPTAEDIVRALAVLGADAVKRLEDAATACAQTETAMGEGYKVKHEVVQAEYGELEAARAALSAPLCMAREWVAENEPTQCISCNIMGTTAQGEAADWRCECGGKVVRVSRPVRPPTHEPIRIQANQHVTKALL